MGVAQVAVDEWAPIGPIDRKCDDQCEQKRMTIDWTALAKQIGGLQVEPRVTYPNGRLFCPVTRSPN